MNAHLTERLLFMRIDDKMKNSLQDLRLILDPHLSGLFGRFYEHVANFSEIRQFFPNAEIIAHAKEKQIDHWRVILSGCFEDEYVDSVTRIAEVHARIGVEPRWYIGAYAFIMREIVDFVNQYVDSDVKQFGQFRSAWISAISTLAMLDMDFTISVYLDFGQRHKQEMTKNIANTLNTFISGIVENVDDCSQKINESSEKLVSVSSSTKESVFVVSDASAKTVKATENLFTASKNLANSIQEITDQVQSSSKVVDSATQITNRLNESMSELFEQTHNISHITEFINKVASQINLLALNATIESTRAGEAGRGFAVVAKEVKNLAGQTSSASTDIAQQVKNIIKASSMAEEHTKTIVETINQISSNIASISLAVNQQHSTTESIAKNVSETTEAANLITRNIKLAETGANQTNDSSVDVMSVAQDLKKQTISLKTKISEFLETIQNV